MSKSDETTPTIWWLRHDLRLADNPALQAGLQRGRPVIPLFIWCPEEENPWAPGAASKCWMELSLRELGEELVRAGSRLILRRGPALQTLLSVARETGARSIVWNRRYEPAVVARDTEIKDTLTSEGLEATSFNAALLREPWEVRNKSGGPFQVFTPFWKHCLTLPDPEAPLPAPRSMPAPRKWPKSLTLSELKLGPSPDWASGIRERWRPGAAGAQGQLKRFLQDAMADYPTNRNLPHLEGTSSLSPHLHFGEISARQVWHAVAGLGLSQWRNSQFLAELGWREFSHHLLYHFPHTPERPLRTTFEKFPWRQDAAGLKAWQKGRTGYPLVDAGMRQLWATGWMHNRVRMVVASFLVKDLLVNWTEGAQWFWDTLVDADLAQNTMGWQWTAGCGADAAPFFRVFNPISQGEKFDRTGEYVRRWIPELARMPNHWVHKPHLAPSEVLERAGVVVGTSYPAPIVSHTSARERALAAYARLKPGVGAV